MWWLIFSSLVTNNWSGQCYQSSIESFWCDLLSSALNAVHKIVTPNNYRPVWHPPGQAYSTFWHNNWHAFHLLHILIWWNALNQLNGFHNVITTHKAIQEFHHLGRKQCWYVINQASLPSQEISRTLCCPQPHLRPGGSGWATWTGMPGLTRPTWLHTVLPKIGTLSRQDRHSCPATL